MKKITILLLILTVVFFQTSSYAEFEKRKAVIVDMDGQASVVTSDGNTIPAEIGMILTEGDEIKTKSNSWVVLNLESDLEQAEVEIKENSEMSLLEFIIDADKNVQKTLLDLAIGEVLITSKKLQSEKSKFEVKTPTSIVGVRGTSFSVTVEAE